MTNYAGSYIGKPDCQHNFFWVDLGEQLGHYCPKCNVRIR